MTVNDEIIPEALIRSIRVNLRGEGEMRYIKNATITRVIRAIRAYNKHLEPQQ